MAERCAIEDAVPFGDVPMDVEIEVDRRGMRLRDILDLSNGSIISFPKTAGDYLNIYVGGAAVGRGEVVVLEKNIGIRVTMFEVRT